MANRNFNKRQCLEHEIKDLYIDQTVVGSAGSQTLVPNFASVDQSTVATNPGIKSIVRLSTGLYRVTLFDAFFSMKFFDAIIVKSSGEDKTIQLKSINQVSVTANKYFDFYTLAAGVLTDLSSGDVLKAVIELKNTNVTI